MTNTMKLTKKQAQAVAMDAILDGLWDQAMAVLEQVNGRGYERCRLTRTQAKQVAHALAKQGRAAESLRVLTSVMGFETAMKELAPVPTATVGDILVASWGYDQTNIDYYQVVAVSGSRVTIREIGMNFAPSQATSTHDVVTPVANAFMSEPMIKRAQKSCSGGYCLKIESYAHAYLWDGKPRHQTGSGYGH